MQFLDWLYGVRGRQFRTKGIAQARPRKGGFRELGIPAMIEVVEQRCLLSGFVSASNDSYETSHDQALVVDAMNGVLNNDFGWDDFNTYTLTASVVANPSHGSLSLNGNGSFTYTPTASYVGADSFTYKATYGGWSMNATVSLAVSNYAPMASGLNTYFEMSHDHVLEVTTPVSDAFDYDDTSLTLTLVSDVEDGALTLNSDGTFEYTPDTGYIGTDSFTVKYVDSLGLSSNEIEVTISVVNNAPMLNVDSYVEIPDDITNGTQIGTATSIDYDYDGVVDVPAYSLSGGSGIFAIDPDTGVITVVNTSGIAGDTDYNLTISVTDGIDTAFASMQVKTVGDWRIISPGDNDTLAQANPLKVNVRHAKDWAWGFKVELRDGTNTLIDTKSKGADAGFTEEFNFGVLTPGTYKIKYIKMKPNGLPDTIEERTITIQ